MSVVFGPIGMVLTRLQVLGGERMSPTRFGVLTIWFALYGAVMGIVLAFAWRVECGRVGRRRRKRQVDGYWIGDWSSVLERPSDVPATPGNTDRRSPLSGSGPSELP
jgi:hypothetical protein